MCYTVLYNSLYNINHFLAMSEVKAILEIIEENHYKSPHLANFDRKYLDDNDENIKMPDVKQITPISDLFISERTIFIKSNFDIYSS